MQALSAARREAASVRSSNDALQARRPGCPHSERLRLTPCGDGGCEHLSCQVCLAHQHLRSLQRVDLSGTQQ